MYRKGVSALIMNGRQEFLLINLISFEEKYFAIPGGGIEEAESLEDAVYREVWEELGIKNTSMELVDKSKQPVLFKFKVIKMNRGGKEYEGSERHFFGFNFIGNEEEIRLRKDEVRKYRWISLPELKNYLLFDNQLKETLEKITEIFPYFNK